MHMTLKQGRNMSYEQHFVNGQGLDFHLKNHSYPPDSYPPESFITCVLTVPDIGKDCQTIF